MVLASASRRKVMMPAYSMQGLHGYISSISMAYAYGKLTPELLAGVKCDRLSVKLIQTD